MPMPTDHVARVSLSDEAYVRIEAAILDGTLQPGERLRDTELVDWLGISRTPIRHALDRLMGQGLVEMERNRYTRVAPFDIVGVRGAVEVAGDLWSGAVRRRLAYWDDDDADLVVEIADSLIDAARSADVVRVVQVFEHLVTTCVLLDGNPARHRALVNVLPQVHRLARKLVGGHMDLGRLRDFLTQLVVAVKAEDGIAAAAHIDTYVTRLVASLPAPS
ncbi:GntR family transcriptional regulator [Leifsonia sp. NPDC058230]|uniref:GntR family transcriptional regulator n=1 Tax=Leifsonia sp. NPDC058230 TaxID=3346391 RepID=UPI0036DE00B9